MKKPTPIKVLVVDDSALMRKLIGQVLSTEPEFEVQFAKNGLEALALNKSFEPHVITLDIQMPGMDGLQCLDRVMVERPVPVVVVSSLAVEATEATLEALRLGAVDAVAKPTGAVSLKLDAFGPQLLAKVRNAASVKLSSARRLRERVKATTKTPRPAKRAPAKSLTRVSRASGEGVVLIGVSTGGPPALEAVLGALPANFAWPVIVAQHMPASFTGALAKRLNQHAAVKIVELAAPVRLEPGTVYIGRGDGDVVVERKAGKLMGSPRPSEPDYLWHPSVDRLVRSALEHVDPAQLIGVLMTGMGNDGASAMALLRARGGRTIAEAEESAVVWGMPGELVRADGADWVLPVGEIGAHLVKLTP